MSDKINPPELITKIDLVEFKFWFLKMLIGQAIALTGIMFAMFQFFLK